MQIREALTIIYGILIVIRTPKIHIAGENFISEDETIDWD